jgi:hypothetical protein
MLRTVVPLFAFFLYAVISTLFYDPASLFRFEFYRWDGNFFVTMTPLLFLASSVFFVDLERTMRWFVYISTFANLAALLVWLVTGQALRPEPSRLAYNPADLILGVTTTPSYHFLFIAHNAAGGFLAILSAFSLALFLSRRNVLTAVILAVNLASLFFTSSRGSMLGLTAGVILVFFAGRLSERFYPLVIGALAINILIVLYVYSNSNIDHLIYRQVLLTKVVATLAPEIAGYLDDNASLCSRST